jgi:hypothetical protein
MFVLTITPVVKGSWLFNIDVYQSFIDPQDNFEIVIKGDWRGGNQFYTTFQNGNEQVFHNPVTDETTIMFYGDPIPFDTTNYQHFGYAHPGAPYNSGQIVRQYWTRVTNQSDTPGGSFGYKYDPNSQEMEVEVMNAMDTAIITTNIRYMVFHEGQPLEDMNRNIWPPRNLTFNGEIENDTILNPGESRSFTIEGVEKNDWIMTFQSVIFEEPPPEGYNEDVGIWTQVLASEMTSSHSCFKTEMSRFGIGKSKTITNNVLLLLSILERFPLLQKTTIVIWTIKTNNLVQLFFLFFYH